MDLVKNYFKSDSVVWIVCNPLGHLYVDSNSSCIRLQVIELNTQVTPTSWFLN